MCYTYDKSKGGDTSELQSRMVPPKKTGSNHLKVNKRTPIVKKTKYMLRGSRPRLELLSDNFTVKVNNQPIETVTVY